MGCAVNAVVSGRIQSSMGNCHGMMMMIPQPTAIGTRIAQILFKMLSQNEENQHCVPWPCVAVRFGAVLCWSMQSHRQTIERKTETKNQNKKKSMANQMRRGDKSNITRNALFQIFILLFFQSILKWNSIIRRKTQRRKAKREKKSC